MTSQVTPYDVNAVGAAKPVLIGESSGSGAIIESISIISLRPTGSGDGTFGLIFAGIPLEVRFYTQRFGDSKLWFEGVFIAGDTNRVTCPDTIFPNYYPILPNPQRAWRLAPNEKFYAGLSIAVPAPGVNIFIRGGQYA
jgi:hypothetical protein